MFTPSKVLSKKTFECSFEDSLIVGNYFFPVFPFTLRQCSQNAGQIF